MFTSRAEHRLSLRQDNAPWRMEAHARRLGILDEAILDEVASVRNEVSMELGRMDKTFHEGASLTQLLRRPEMSYAQLPGSTGSVSTRAKRQVEVEAKYAGYIQREKAHILQAEKSERQLIPRDLDYDAITAMRYESREKLKKIRPESLGQAGRISGVNPADISILSVWLKKIKS
jgi:tRNA uridine 5-carboxymethylaminomethyl modification enzyme